jgi:hypothetical protein
VPIWWPAWTACRRRAGRAAGELPSRGQQPLGLVLRVALNEWLPDAYKLLPPARQPGRARAGAARYARRSPTAAPPAPAGTLARHRRVGRMAGRRATRLARGGAWPLAAPDSY